MAYTTLPPLVNNRPKSIISLDVEQDVEGDAYVFCVCGINERGVKDYNRVFDNAKDCAAFLFDRRWVRTILTGNNLLFDLNHLTLAGCFNWEILSSSGSFITALPSKKDKKKYGGKALEIIEVNNFYPKKSLISMVTDKEGICLPEYVEYCDKHNCDPYIDKHILGDDGNIKEMTRACKSHCWAAVYALSAMQDQIIHLGSGIEITPALTAQKLHRRKYLSEVCQIYGQYDQVTDNDKLFMNQAYYGGRTENFLDKDQIGELLEDVSGIDLNSSYPSSMRNNPFPDMLSYRERSEITVKGLIEMMGEFEGLASVLIKCPDIDIPYLPVKQDGKLKFPSGSWVASYTFPDLRFALEIGYEIKEVYRVGVCRPTKDPLFKEYVDALYPLKKDPRYKEGAKLMLNSLYGKFGQKRNETTGWQIITEERESEISAEEFKQDNFRIALNGLALEHIVETPIEERGFSDKSYPLISAYVSSYSRKTLWLGMKAIGFEDVHYCDTDSIYGKGDSIEQAIERGDIESHPDKLGAWDVEHNRVTIEIRGLKYYRIFEGGEWKYAIKGVPAKYQPIFWRDREVMVERVWKRPSAVRFGKKLNSFYSHPLKEQHPKSKRAFDDMGCSIPIKLLAAVA